MTEVVKSGGVAAPLVDDAAAAGAGQARGPWIEGDLRKVAAATCAGLVAGFTVNAVGGRLAMMLLAKLNPDATGRLSDDGFMMGQFDLMATLNLVVIATAIGVLGGLIFLGVRQLRIGPAWFQTLSITAGPAIVVGAMLVHTSGVDFVILKPAWLAVALFVVLPAAYASVVSRVADRWLRPGSWFLSGSRSRLLSLAPLVLVAPAAPLVVGGAMARAVYQSVPGLRGPGRVRLMRMGARGGLTLIFVLALVDLARDLIILL